MSKKQKLNKNYLENIPCKAEGIGWSQDEKGMVTLEIQNKGFFNRALQLLIKKPKISYIHLDDTGSFVWPLIDEQKNITELGVLVKEHFGDKAEPLYERLAKYFQILESYRFITFK